MDALEESEAALNAIVKEYLDMMEYTATLKIFEEEVKARNSSIDESKLPPKEDQSQNRVQNAMTEAFKSGNCQAFFRLWNKHLPEDIYQNDNDCRRLEFNLSLYFAIYPFFDDNFDQSSSSSSDMSLKIFKNYLETRGQSLSQTTEFVMFYALPFVRQPRDHPSFKALFEPSWAKELGEKLDNFLGVTFCTKPLPFLFRLHSGIAEKSTQDKQQSMVQINALKQQAGLLELKASQYLKKYTKIQKDYHNLIGIAAELVDSLESTVRGNMVSPDYLQGVCERLFSNAQSNSDSIDFTRPGTAGSILRASIVNANVGNSVGHDDLYYPSLNFDKIKADLATSSTRKKALILQALRWRLTQSKSTDQMDAAISSYIAHDILGCSMNQNHLRTITGMLFSREEILREYIARLLNTLASFTQGRTYLSEGRSLIIDMFHALKKEPKASTTSENLLGAMQKVSMRRDVQTNMIANGVVEWLLKTLEEFENFSDYSLEYSVALLMNLCLRSAGKKICLPRAERTLKLLTELMASENQEIRPYLNGALYSILSLPSVRQRAVAMGLEEILQCFYHSDQPEMNRQVQFIITKINTSELTETDDPQSDDEEEEEDEDEEGDAVDPEMDKDEPLVAKKGELCGEMLFSEEYLAVLPTSNSTNGKGKKKPLTNTLTLGKNVDRPISRPVTPGNRTSLTAIKEVPKPSSPARAEGKETEMERPRTQSAKSTRKTQGEQSRPTSRNQAVGSKPEGSGSELNTKQYGEVFASRPKIPRSPDMSTRSESRPGSGRPTSRTGSARPGTANRPKTASPPPPVKSTSPTRGSRPTSKSGGNSGRNTAGSSQQSRGRKAQER